MAGNALYDVGLRLRAAELYDMGRGRQGPGAAGDGAAGKLAFLWNSALKPRNPKSTARVSTLLSSDLKEVQQVEQAKKGAAASSRTRSVAFVGLAVAIMAVSAWVTVPLGPVPFTLQMFAITFAIVMLSPKECMAAIVLYLALGAIGLPVFSGMSGGIAKLMGPTGGFLWGYIFGVAAAVGLLYVLRRRMGAGEKAGAADQRGFIAFLKNAGAEIAAGIVFTTIAYFCGWLQLMLVMGISPQAAFLTGVAPFVVVDVLKILAAVACARAVKAAVR